MIELLIRGGRGVKKAFCCFTQFHAAIDIILFVFFYCIESILELSNFIKCMVKREMCFTLLAHVDILFNIF